MQKLNTEKRIQAFNDTNQPFYIVDLDDGKYSLCLPLDLLGNEFYPYCQAAFDAYAVEVGDPPVTERGLKTHGNGYEWEAAFCQAFEGDPKLKTRDWVTLTGKLVVEKHKLYRGKGPVLHVIKTEFAVKPAQEVATFY